MKWNLKGCVVSGVYQDFSHVNGTVIGSQRDKYGNIQHTVELSRPMLISGKKKTRVIIDDSNLTRIIPPLDRNQD